MNKLIPAVFFQKHVNADKNPGADAAASKPQVLEMYEDEMRKIVGGQKPVIAAKSRMAAEAQRFSGSTTYSGSEGWLDVAQADDCGF